MWLPLETQTYVHSRNGTCQHASHLPTYFATKAKFSIKSWQATDRSKERFEASSRHRVLCLVLCKRALLVVLYDACCKLYRMLYKVRRRMLWSTLKQTNWGLLVQIYKDSNKSKEEKALSLQVCPPCLNTRALVDVAACRNRSQNDCKKMLVQSSFLRTANN